MAKNSFKIVKNWKTVLSPSEYRVLVEKGTEPSGTGKYNKHFPENGVYSCAACKSPIYKASAKFDSGCGWPAFYEAIPGAILTQEDNSFGMTRTELLCKACGCHLGHLFKGEGYNNPTDERHCVNSKSLHFDS